MNVPCEQLKNKKGLWCAWPIWQDVGQELRIQKKQCLANVTVHLRSGGKLPNQLGHTHFFLFHLLQKPIKVVEAGNRPTRSVKGGRGACSIQQDVGQDLQKQKINLFRLLRYTSGQGERPPDGWGMPIFFYSTCYKRLLGLLGQGPNLLGQLLTHPFGSLKAKVLTRQQYLWKPYGLVSGMEWKTPLA